MGLPHSVGEKHASVTVATTQYLTCVSRCSGRNNEDSNKNDKRTSKSNYFCVL